MENTNKETASKENKPLRFFRHIVPFYFPEDYDKVISGLRSYIDDTGEYTYKPLSLTKGDSDLYEHILKSFAVPGSSDEKSELGKAFGLSVKNNKNDGYKKELVFSCALNETRRDLNIVLSEFRLILFRTSIGFLTYDLDIRPPEGVELTIADLQKIQYELKEIAQNKDKKKNNELSGLDKKFKGCLGGWIKELLSLTVCENVGFFPNRKSSVVGNKPDKALLYTYILDPKPDCGDLPKSGSHKERIRLVLGMKDSYDIVDDVKFTSSFKNIFWYAAYEASGVIAYYGESNEKFLKSFDDRVKHDYFIIYLLTLYRHYSTIKLFSELSGKLSADFADYSDPSKNKELSQKLEEFESKINVFLLKSSFSSVSYIDQHNKYYNFCKEQLRIEENIKSLSDGLTPLAKMQRIYKDQKENEDREKSEKKEQEIREQQEAEQKKHDRKMDILGIAFTLFGVASILTDGFGYFGTVNDDNEWVNQMVPVKWVGLGMAVLLIVGAILWFVSPWSKKSGSGRQPGQNAGQAQPEPDADLSQPVSGESASSEEPDQETGREEQTQ